MFVITWKMLCKCGLCLSDESMRFKWVGGWLVETRERMLFFIVGIESQLTHKKKTYKKEEKWLWLFFFC